MSQQPTDTQGSEKPRRPRGDLWTMLLFGLLMLAGLAVVGLGVVVAARPPHQFTVLAVGVLAVIVPASVYPLLLGLGGAQGSNTDEAVALLRSINQRALLSDQAKRVAYRETERQALRDAIIEDIRKQDYDAALVLVDAMASLYGYREEAEQFREQIIDARQKQRDQQIASAIANVEQLSRQYDWQRAFREVQRLERLFPDSPAVANLPQRIEQARDEHKREVERQFLTAAESGNVENALELLKELDRYLSPEEAERYIETARGIVGKARENLGVQFKLSVQDRDWISALNTGEAIIREFPNSKMADEVRGMLDVLRERAAGQRAADRDRR